MHVQNVFEKKEPTKKKPKQNKEHGSKKTGDKNYVAKSSEGFTW